MERIQKLIAQAGVASRRQAEKLILEKRVTLNGEVVHELGTKAGINDKIEVDGVPIYKEEPVYFLFNKPSGVISSVTDDKGRTTVTDYFKTIEQRIYPVGRLDYDTQGLLILTNDGELANYLMHPKSQIAKTYVAKLAGVPNSSALDKLTKGIVIDGKKTAPAIINVISIDKVKDQATIEITIHEGRNHQVKKMFEAIGSKVIKLKRTHYAFLDLANVGLGNYRPLKNHEVKKLYGLGHK